MLIIGKVSGINTSDGLYNVQVNNNDGKTYNLKASEREAKQIQIAGVYEFDCEVEEGERVHYNVKSVKNVMAFDFETKNKALRDFFDKAPLSLPELEKEINRYVSLIDNKIIKAIVDDLMAAHHDDYFLYPAASRMHHAYVGGLAYHCVGMLNLADGYLKAYPFLNKDYLYAGIILHDIGKTRELSGIIAPDYSAEGQLLGHLVIGAMEINEAAKKLGFANCEEAMILEHMLVSHHGVPQFGSAKKPMTAEALALWLIDTADSKLRVLSEEFAKVDNHSFTAGIGVMDKQKMYKA